MVVSELRGEKIDIIPYNEEPARFVAKALSPARVREVLVDDEDRQATVIVPDDQLSLAIGREGQNARLAAKLTGWRVDIVGESEFAERAEEEGYEDEEEQFDGRCMAVLSAGRRCPNAALPGSRYCGLPTHQALARFTTNQVTVLSPLSEEEVALLADGDAAEGEVGPIVTRAETAFAEAGPKDEVVAAEVDAEAEAGEDETVAAAVGTDEGAGSAEDEQLIEEEAVTEAVAADVGEKDLTAIVADEEPAEAAPSTEPADAAADAEEPADARPDAGEATEEEGGADEAAEQRVEGSEA
jgi:N utilization substance protein A